MAAAPKVGDRLLPIDWGEISPLRMHAHLVAEGAFAGGHRSRKRGPGVEFGGQRPYTPGDDLRFLDRRSLLRHDRLMVRQFETETERAVWLCVDASASMAYRGPNAPGAKLAYAALLAAALARVAVAGHDPVGLNWLQPGTKRVLDDVLAGFGFAAFERVTAALESAVAVGDMSNDVQAVQRSTHMLARRCRRGGVVVLFTDLLDLPDRALEEMMVLASGPRAMVVVRILDPRERDLSFEGKVRLKSIEGAGRVVTDADAVRAEYQRRLQAQSARCRATVEMEGGRLVEACTSDEPVMVLRSVLQAIAEARR